MRTILVLPLLLACTGAAPDTGGDTADTADTADPIVPGTETVTTTWDVDLFSEYQSPTIPRFDTLDGRRALDGMTIRVDHTAEMTVDVENASTFALAPEDYSVELYFQTIIQLGASDDVEDSFPFFGPGAFTAVVSEPLAAGDGVEGEGDDHVVRTSSETVQFEAEYDWEETPTYLEVMTGEGELQLVVGGFSEVWTWWGEDVGEDALLYAGNTALRYSGTMTVTYAYSPVDE